MSAKEHVMEAKSRETSEASIRYLAEEGLNYKCTLRVMKGSMEHQWLIGLPDELICGFFCQHGDGADVYIRYSDRESDLYILVDVFDDDREFHRRRK